MSLVDHVKFYINLGISKKDAIKKHLELLKTHFSRESTLVSYFKKHLMWYVKNSKNASKTKLKILEFTTLKQIEDLIESLDE